ncbi:Protein of uncharacterised function (DUF987) [Edwardsiella tarda]|nr:Protein of uncharacterised function (DUF987) [Edwardsiella tarda]
MKIMSKGEAIAIHRRYPGSRIFRFDKGKYRWYGTLSHGYGKEVNDIPGVLAVFAERRQGVYEPYTRLMCITLN